MADEYGYNLFQQIYCLSMATGIVSNKKGSEKALQDAMIECLDQALLGLSGDWALSWGPRVYKEKNKDSDEGGPDNVWFAAIDHNQKVCVLAIAGTADGSWADIWQDFDVHEVVDFNAWVNLWSPNEIPEPQASNPAEIEDLTRPYCAKGTCIGVWNVLSNFSTAASQGTRIDQYLSSLDPSYTVVVTGHSLGGALAPTVALGLSKSKLGSPPIMKVLPSAGVSPGNERFANDYTALFPKNPESGQDYQVYNTDYYNHADIVPQAWSTNPDHDRNLHNILDIMLRIGDSLRREVEAIVKLAIFQSESSRIRYTPLPGQSFSGAELPAYINSWDELKTYHSNQHVLVYWDRMGITKFMKQFEDTF
ncbi:hypothetical protein F4861DRAFT_503791 [Xylaria intraflava]|nr:hypothetical protein F4861DRAFT_503791 [Xylaria intraflava]